MLPRLWWFVRAHVETFRQYRSAVVTAEALIWHHGYKGLDAALKAADWKALIAERDSSSGAGQMVRVNEASLPEVVPASA